MSDAHKLRCLARTQPGAPCNCGADPTNPARGYVALVDGLVHVTGCPASMNVGAECTCGAIIEAKRHADQARNLHAHKPQHMAQNQGNSDAMLGATHLRTLNQRRAYLEQRMTAKKNIGMDIDYDARERDALKWALDQLHVTTNDAATKAVFE